MGKNDDNRDSMAMEHQRGASTQSDDQSQDQRKSADAYELEKPVVPSTNY
jgi:hypothetical protein